MIIAKAKRKILEQLEDCEIVRIILENEDFNLMEILYDRYARMVYYKCLKLTVDKYAAQDLMQDIMVKIITNLREFRGHSDFSFWVNAITYNHCMDYLKKKKRMRFEDGSASRHLEVQKEDEEPESHELRDLQFLQLERLMNELNHSERSLIMMRYQEKMSMREIANCLQISESAVKMRLRRGLDRLAKDLKGVRVNDKSFYLSGTRAL